jgi:arsenate reductase
MTVEIFHNPRCSKSRQTLALLEKKGIRPQIRLYLENPPSKKELEAVLKKLKLEATDLLRTKEDLYQTLLAKEGKPNPQKALEWMVQHPKLIERPIVIKGSKAVIGRPPENVLKIL